VLLRILRSFVPRSPARGALLLLPLAALLFAACEKPQSSDLTSPSARIMIGTTEGTVTINPTEAPPAPKPAPEGWRLNLENARFAKLENDNPSLQVSSDIRAHHGSVYEIWISGPEGPIYRWTGGSSREYDGVVCFQLLVDDGQAALPFGNGPLTMTTAFRDKTTGEVVAADDLTIAGFPPSGRPAPDADSKVGKILLGCPRSVI